MQTVLSQFVFPPKHAYPFSTSNIPDQITIKFNY